MSAAHEIARQGHGRMILAKDAIHPHELRHLCEIHWRAKGVASYHRPTAWFVEFIQGFGFRLTPEPPWAKDAPIDEFLDDIDEFIELDPDEAF
jgi:hypothetical protein